MTWLVFDVRRGRRHPVSVHTSREAAEAWARQSLEAAVDSVSEELLMQDPEALIRDPRIPDYQVEPSDQA